MNTLRRVRLWVAVLVSTSAGILVICTFLLPGTSIPGAFVWAAFGLALPIFGAALVPGALETCESSRSRSFAWGRKQGRLYWRRTRERIHWPVALVIAAILVLGWFAGMTAVLQLSAGVPERHGARYFSDDHGVLTPLTKAEYEREVAIGYRGLSAASMALCAIAAGVVIADPLRPDREKNQP